MLGYRLGKILINSSLIFLWGSCLTTAFPLVAFSRENKSLLFSENNNQENIIAQTTNLPTSLRDGIYLYGSSPQPEEIGEEYLVFQVRSNKAIGAIYSPRSEFSCFSAAFDSQQMNLAIIDPYAETSYPYAIALAKVGNVASVNQISHSLTLQGYKLIPQISDNDQRILNACLDYYQQDRQ
jgi:hypothetical protein